MKLFDSHNHLQDERIFPRVGKVIERARAAGVANMAVKGCSSNDWNRVIQCMEQFDGIFPAFGIHPWYVSRVLEKDFRTLENLLRHYPQASVGEIGIDHAVENRDDALQEEIFLRQLEIARRFNRLVTIHCRRAWGRLIELLDQFGELPRGMLIHCFGGSAEMAKELLARGAYISFSGSITRPNNKKAGPAIRAVPDERILIETDAPDILPAGASGEFNEPANLPLVLAKAAELRGASAESLAEITFRNAQRLFSRG